MSSHVEAQKPQRILTKRASFGLSLRSSRLGVRFSHNHLVLDLEFANKAVPHDLIVRRLVMDGVHVGTAGIFAAQ